MSSIIFPMDRSYYRSREGEMCPDTLMLPCIEGWGELVLFLLTQKGRTPTMGNAWG